MKSSVHGLFTLRPSSVSPEDFFLLLSFVSRKSKEYLVAHPEHLFSETINQKFDALLQRRACHEPIAYLIGQKEFYGFQFSVNSSTLIPRPETELLVEAVIESIVSQTNNPPQHTKKKVLTLVDVGTGSGNILLSLLKTLEKKMLPIPMSCFGLDISNEAINLAKKNARVIHPNIRARFLQSDLLQALPSQAISLSAHVYILANLPYLSEHIYQNCTPDVKEYEPASALVSEMQGCLHIERLLREIAVIHSTHPELPVDIWLEISPEQKVLFTKKIQTLLPAARHCFQKDLAQKYRFIHILLRA